MLLAGHHPPILVPGPPWNVSQHGSWLPSQEEKASKKAWNHRLLWSHHILLLLSYSFLLLLYSFHQKPVNRKDLTQREETTQGCEHHDIGHVGSHLKNCLPKERCTLQHKYWVLSAPWKSLAFHKSYYCFCISKNGSNISSIYHK